MNDQELRLRLKRVREHLDLAHEYLLGTKPPLDSIVGAAIQVAIATIEVDNISTQLPPDVLPVDELFL